MKFVFGVLLLFNLLVYAWYSLRPIEPLGHKIVSSENRGIPRLLLLSEQTPPVTRQDLPEIASRSQHSSAPTDRTDGDADDSSSEEASVPEVEMVWETRIEDSSPPLAKLADSLWTPPALPIPRRSEKLASRPQRVCHRLGPISEASIAHELTASLQEQAMQVQVRKEQQKVVGTYWVMMPPQENSRATQQVLDTVDEYGIRDVLVLFQGKFKDYISFGIYAELSNAERRQARLTELGLKTKIRPRYKEAEVFWLDIRSSADLDGANKLRELLSEIETDLPLNIHECPVIAMD